MPDLDDDLSTWYCQDFQEKLEGDSALGAFILTKDGDTIKVEGFFKPGLGFVAQEDSIYSALDSIKQSTQLYEEEIAQRWGHEVLREADFDEDLLETARKITELALRKSLFEDYDWCITSVESSPTSVVVGVRGNYHYEGPFEVLGVPIVVRFD
tara:strand:- start:62716 stop:63177 length:462 start_codon:yes stop_codon:yes gene_type:complete